MTEMQQSFDLKLKNKNRALSIEMSKKFKGNESTKRNTILERVKADKVRVNELKNINVDLIVKYANKFHLDDRPSLSSIKQMQ